jgi:hypothetical protein
MDIQAILNIGLYIALMIFILSSVGLILLVCVYLAKRARKSRKIHRSPLNQAHPTNSSFSITKQAKKDILPNGFSRQDYYDHGADDSAIDYFGLDEPGAPEPGIAGIVLMDLFEGDDDEK